MCVSEMSICCPGILKVSVAYSESLLSELDPLELLLPDSEELLLLRREGPPEGAEPDFSKRSKTKHLLVDRIWHSSHITETGGFVSCGGRVSLNPELKRSAQILVSLVRKPRS